MAYDYSKLNGRIVEKCGTQGNFAVLMGLSERSVSLKLNGKVCWKQPEMMKALQILQLNPDNLKDYFFAYNVQNI